MQAKAYNFIKKETPTQVFSCEFCKDVKDTFFYITPRVAAFGILKNFYRRKHFRKKTEETKDLDNCI